MRLNTLEPRRPGFTLVEMMVAMALTVFILVILAQAFGTGLETFRQLKALGDLQEGLRVAALRLRTDLAYDHFEARRRLSDVNFWASGGKPVQGFFCIKQGSPSLLEGTDLDGIPSYRATNHILWFAVKLRGVRQEDFLSASVPAGSPLLGVSTSLVTYNPDNQWQTTANYSGQWAEVAYYLVQTGSTVEPGNPASTAGTPLFTLYRAQRVIVPNNTNLTNKIRNSASYTGMSCENNAGFLYFNTPMDVAGNNTTNKSVRAITIPGDASGAPLLENVVSFQVQVSGATPSTISTAANGTSTTVIATASATFTDLSAFDTASTPSPTTTIGAVQITLRVWDIKTSQSRQITVVQDL